MWVLMGNRTLNQPFKDAQRCVGCRFRRVVVGMRVKNHDGMGLLKHMQTVEEEEEEEEENRLKKIQRATETPLGNAFRCRDCPTAEYCRRVVVMETGRQSLLFIVLYKNNLLHPSLPPLQTEPGQEARVQPAARLPAAPHKDRTGGAGTQGSS